MFINTKSRCGMCRENKDSADFLNEEGKPTNLCLKCRNLMKAFISTDKTKDEIRGTAKEILTQSGMPVEQIADLISPAAAADNVVMKAIGMDVFNNRIKPANVMPGSKLAQEVMRIPAPPTSGEFKFAGMIGYDSAADSAESFPAVTVAVAAAGDQQWLLNRSSFSPVPKEELPLNKFPESSPKPAEPPAEIGRVARAIAGEDEE